ncbi:hypothetical protein ABZW30_22055 [Kitasatospora sp. NPDC004669]|uniref:hypothetical protein n=1 Tax=Kitasatospora sp. NPDC004669 TaxID=3154555 RepID=UPI0033B011C1
MVQGNGHDDRRITIHQLLQHTIGSTAESRRSTVVPAPEARGDGPQHVLGQRNAAGTLIDHALRAGGPNTPWAAPSSWHGP